MPIIIPAGETRPVKIPKNCQIDIIEHPTGTEGHVLLHCKNPPENISYPLQKHPHPIVYVIDDEICCISNEAAAGSHVVIT
jgi:hypothetical protein